MEQVRKINIFIASSAELKAERQACDEVILKLNNEIDDYKFKAELFETSLSSGNNPSHKGIQDRINKNLLDKCPITICLFHRKAGEWTIEEFERSQKNGKKVFVFLKDEYGRSDRKDYKEDLENLDKFIDSIEPYVLYKSYKTPNNDLSQFKELVKTQIKLYLKELTQQTEPQVTINPTPVVPTPKHPKHLTNLQSINPNKIIGRTKDLADLTTQLNQHQEVVLMNGMGGIGKTTLAQAYVFQEQEKYQHIAWITQTIDDFITDFATNQTLCSNLGIKPESFTDPAKLFTQVCNKLNNLTAHPKLLVIDNALPSLAKFLPYLPKQPNWHLLITSREALPNPNLHTMQLGFLTPTDAEQLFTKHCQRLSAEEVSKLVSQVQLHTLTIEILAKAAQYRKLSYKQLSEALALNTEANVAVPRNNNEKLARITDYLCSIFKLSQLTENQQWLLKQFACLPPDMQAYNDLRTWIKSEQTKQQEHFAELLNELCAQSWLLSNAKNEQYKMHPIIQAVCLKQLKPSVDDVEPLIGSFIDLLNQENQNHNPVLCFRYIPFGETITNIFESSEAVIIAVLQNNLGLVLQDFGRFERAKVHLQKALKSDINNFGENDERVAIRYSNLALVLKALGDYEQAKTHLQKALKSDINNFGENHPKTAISYSNLALVLKDLGEFEQGKTYLQKALKAAINNFGENHPTTATRYSNLALVLKDLGEFEQAKIYLQKALKSDINNFGENHPKTAISYSNLALVLKDLGDYEQAKTYLQKALQSAINNFGENHPTTAISYSNLATVLQNLGDYEQAKTYLQKALKSDIKNYGENHPSTAISYNNLGSLLYSMKQYKTALIHAEKALAIRKAVLPAGHPHIKISEDWVAGIKKAL